MQTKDTGEKPAFSIEIMLLANREAFFKRAKVPDWWRTRFTYIAYMEERVLVFEPSSNLQMARLPSARPPVTIARERQTVNLKTRAQRRDFRRRRAAPPAG
jgi:hypothetical protein